jgi:hypothetical protein
MGLRDVLGSPNDSNRSVLHLAYMSNHLAVTSYRARPCFALLCQKDLSSDGSHTALGVEDLLGCKQELRSLEGVPQVQKLQSFHQGERQVPSQRRPGERPLVPQVPVPVLPGVQGRARLRQRQAVGTDCREVHQGVPAGGGESACSMCNRHRQPPLLCCNVLMSALPTAPTQAVMAPLRSKRKNAQTNKTTPPITGKKRGSTEVWCPAALMPCCVLLCLANLALLFLPCCACCALLCPAVPAVLAILALLCLLCPAALLLHLALLCLGALMGSLCGTDTVVVCPLHRWTRGSLPPPEGSVAR